MQKIKTVLLAGSDVADNFKKYNNRNDVEIAAVFNGSDINHAESAEAVKDAVIIIDAVTVPPATVDRLISVLKSNRGYIAIVTDIKNGFDYLNRGAVDMIVKPDPLTPQNAEGFIYSLCTKLKISGKQGAEVYRRELKYSGAGISDKIIAIGASTGGTEIVLNIIKNLPFNCPPVVVAQHMPPVFTKLYAQRVHSICAMSVWEAKQDDILRPGLVLIAPGDYQMRVVNKNNSFTVDLTAGEKINGHAPSVDALFSSVANSAGSRSVGVILTGMGSDGAQGLLEMKQKGAATFGQDEQSSTVYGMPRAAYEIGAVGKQVGTTEMACEILKAL